MTTQSEQDELPIEPDVLENVISRAITYGANMASKFPGIEPDKQILDIFCEQALISTEVLQLIHQRELSLLEKIEKSPILLRDPYRGKNNAMSVAYRHGARDTNDTWRQTLQAMRETLTKTKENNQATRRSMSTCNCSCGICVNGIGVRVPNPEIRRVPNPNIRSNQEKE